MAELDHWHPVARASDLGRRPRAITLAGVDIALFRTASGGVGALADVCPHRRMKLSRGWVEGERLVCPYHGMSFAPDGAGRSEGTPGWNGRACAFDAVERHGVVWVKAAGADAAFPAVEREGFTPIGTLDHTVRAPLELVIDNFCEVEHTPTTHDLFGFAPGSLAAIDVAVDKGEDWVGVVNIGPQKRVPRVVERVFGVRRGDLFVDAWVVRFSPVHIVYSQYWLDPATRARRDGDNEIHLAVFFNPVEPDVTQIMTFASVARPPLGVPGLGWLLRPLMMRLVDREVRLDQRMLEQLASDRVDLGGARLGRFDAALSQHRRRIDRIYRGRSPVAGPA